MKMNCLLAALQAGSLAAFLGTATGQVQAADTFSEAFTQGDLGISFRYRFEHVEQDNFDKNAMASTLRARLNLKTDDWKGFGLFVEFDYVAKIGWNDFNAAAGNTPDKTEYPVVADPKGPDLNQAYIQWENGNNVIRGGRQRIIYDNARFVGDVGWRQNEQTYDAASYRFKNKAGVDLQFAYVDQVNRIFGRDVPAGTNNNNTWLANLARNWKDVGRLTGYYYDIDNMDAVAFSTRTYGVRFAGSRKLTSTTLGYAAEFAIQDDVHNNPVDYSADYYRFDLSLALSKITPYIGFESLGGDDTRSGAAFRTPLATLHAFNGWADKFLATPDAGLNDLFAGLKGKLGKWSWNVIYHDFEAESGDESFGRELDAALSRKFAEHYSVLFRGAWFSGDASSPYDDTTKLWVQLTADF